MSHKFFRKTQVEMGDHRSPRRRGWLRALLLSLLVFGIFLGVGLDSALAQEKPEPLYLSFEERIVVSYLLAGAGAAPEQQLEIAARLRTLLHRYINAPVQTVSVDNFESFLASYRGSWPGALDLNGDLELLEKAQTRGLIVYKTNNPDLEAEIDRFILRQHQHLVQLIGWQPMAEVLGKLDSSSAVAIDSDAKILSAFAEATDFLERQMAEIQKTGSAFAREAFAGRANEKLHSQAMMTFMSVVFEDYFGQLSLGTKKQILSGYLGEDLNMPMEKKFQVMMRSSGPQFQKLLQVVAGESELSPQTLKIFKTLESDVPSVPPAIVAEIFESERENYQWRSYELVPIGTGTMAQVHLAKLRTGEQVVVRFLKPGIVDRVEEDYRILKAMAPRLDANQDLKAAGFPRLAGIVEDLNQVVRDELDLAETIQRQRRGRLAYDGEYSIRSGKYKNSLLIHVPEVISAKTKNTQVMVQEKISGEKLDSVTEKYASRAPLLKRALVEKLAEVWVAELLFGSGFIHSDLHQGNYLVDYSNEKIRLYLLDFGMGATIPAAKRRAVLLLSAAIEARRPDLIARGLFKLSDSPRRQISLPAFEKAVRKKLELMAEPEMRIEIWSAWAMDQGLRFPAYFVSMNRGLTILEKSLENAGSKKTVNDFGELAARRNKWKTYQYLRETGLSFSEVMKLGWAMWRDPSKNGPSEMVPVRSSERVAQPLKKSLGSGRILSCQKVYL